MIINAMTYQPRKIVKAILFVSLFCSGIGNTQTLTLAKTSKATVDINATQRAVPETDDPNGEFPPTITKMEIFKLEEPGREFNAATLIQFDREQDSAILEEGRFVTRMDDIETEFNDLGEGPDLEPRDGIFSALTRIDFEALRKDEELFIRRVEKLEKPIVKAFSGRTVVATERFDLDAAMEQLPSPKEPIMLGGKIRAFPVPVLMAVLKALPFTANENKVLAVNNTSVVSHPGFTFDPCDTDGTGNNVNPNNPWSFKTLMSNLNQGTGLTDQEFIHEWLRNWMVNGSVNGFNIPARPNIVDYFPGWDGVNAATLDINNLPFRLLAIMNRIDLAKISYASASEGEIRFVFGLLNPNTCTPAVSIDQMAAIFEYGDTANTCSTIKSRAQQWLDLDTLAVGSLAYMNALKAITDDVTQAPNAASQLNQLRTNDFAFDGIGSLALDWNLREFIVDSGSGLLVPTTTKQTPDISFRTGSPVTAQFMEDNAHAILCESHTVPEQYLGSPFLAASLDYLNTSFWSAPTSQANLPAAFPGCHTSSASGVSPFITTPVHIQSEVRHKFSINTCDDCHARETDTTFTHVNPITRGFSGFMTGVTVSDPLLGGVAFGGIDREFDDLQRRGQINEELAANSCSGPLILNSTFFEQTVPMTFDH